MLAEVPWKVQNKVIKLDELGDPRAVDIQTRIAELMLGFIVWIFPFPTADQRGEF